MKQLITILLLFTSFMVAKPKFTDKQIAAMTPQYFSRNHSAPKLVGLKIYTDNGQRIYHVEIKADRNRSSEDFKFCRICIGKHGAICEETIQKICGSHAL